MKKKWWHALAGKFDSDPVYAESPRKAASGVNHNDRRLAHPVMRNRGEEAVLIPDLAASGWVRIIPTTASFAYTGTVMQATSAQPDLVLSPEVRVFCEKRDLVNYLRVALRLATHLFDPPDKPRVTLETDPETDDESVVIDIAAPMEVDEAVEKMREYTRQWVQSAPPDVLGLIRLVPDIA